MDDEIRKTKLFILYNDHDYQGVLDLVAKITKEHPNDVYSLSYAADSYRQLKMYDKSIEVLKYILSIDCMNIPAKLDLFDILYKLNMYEEAKPLLEEIKTFDCEEVKKHKEYYDSASEIIEAYLMKKKEKEHDFNLN